VIIRDEVEALGIALFMQRNVLLNRAEIVAKVQFAGRLNAAQDAFHGFISESLSNAKKSLGAHGSNGSSRTFLPAIKLRIARPKANVPAALA
jgi:hypothetical protein